MGIKRIVNIIIVSILLMGLIPLMAMKYEYKDMKDTEEKKAETEEVSNDKKTENSKKNATKSTNGYILIFIILSMGGVVFMMGKKRNKRRKIIGLFPKNQDLVTINNGPKVRIKPGNAQNMGKRGDQQDSFGFSDLYNKDLVKEIGVLTVVADGMGGLENGKEASNKAVEIMLEEYPRKSENEEIPDALNHALRKANGAVYDLALEFGGEGHMGTTLVATVIHENKLYWISVGDSRIYLFRDNRITQLTTDHVYANELNEQVKNGYITKEEAENHRERGALTSFLGIEQLMEIDQNHRPFTLVNGDRILLCSDGLYGSLNDGEMEIGLQCNSPQEAAEMLIETVMMKDYPYQDNITVAIIGYEEIDD